MEMAVDLCVDEKDETRGSEAQSAVKAKARVCGGGVGSARAPSRPHGRLSLALSLCIFLVDAKAPSRLNRQISHCFGMFFTWSG